MCCLCRIFVIFLTTTERQGLLLTPSSDGNTEAQRHCPCLRSSSCHGREPRPVGPQAWAVSRCVEFRRTQALSLTWPPPPCPGVGVLHLEGHLSVGLGRREGRVNLVLVCLPGQRQCPGSRFMVEPAPLTAFPSWNPCNTVFLPTSPLT